MCFKMYSFTFAEGELLHAEEVHLHIGADHPALQLDVVVPHLPAKAVGMSRGRRPHQ